VAGDAERELQRSGALPGATGYEWAVRFQNGKYTNGWWINGDTFTMGSSCYDPGV
jgi:hypothetical protein